MAKAATFSPFLRTAANPLDYRNAPWASGRVPWYLGLAAVGDILCISLHFDLAGNRSSELTVSNPFNILALNTSLQWRSYGVYCKGPTYSTQCGSTPHWADIHSKQATAGHGSLASPGVSRLSAQRQGWSHELVDIMCEYDPACPSVRVLPSRSWICLQRPVVIEISETPKQPVHPGQPI